MTGPVPDLGLHRRGRDLLNTLCLLVCWSVLARGLPKGTFQALGGRQGGMPCAHVEERNTQ